MQDCVDNQEVTRQGVEQVSRDDVWVLTQNVDGLPTDLQSPPSPPPTRTAELVLYTNVARGRAPSPLCSRR